MASSLLQSLCSREKLQGNYFGIAIASHCTSAVPENATFLQKSKQNRNPTFWLAGHSRRQAGSEEDNQKKKASQGGPTLILFPFRGVKLTATVKLHKSLSLFCPIFASVVLAPISGTVKAGRARHIQHCEIDSGTLRVSLCIALKLHQSCNTRRSSRLLDFQFLHKHAPNRRQRSQTQPNVGRANARNVAFKVYLTGEPLSFFCSSRSAHIASSLFVLDKDPLIARTSSKGFIQRCLRRHQCRKLKLDRSG